MSEDLTAILAAIRAEALGSIAYADNHACPDIETSCSAHHALRLLAAVTAVLELHRPDGRNIEYVPCEQHAIWHTDGLPAGAQASCPDCRIVETVLCWQKGCEDYGWPCPTYRAITAALSGKEDGGGPQSP